MTVTIVNSGFKEERLVRMMALSFGLHLAVFSTTLFIPQTTINYPSIGERVYHVELVGSPSRVRSGAIGSPSGAGTGTKARGVAKGKETSNILKDTTQRIAVKEKRAAPIVARRVSPKPMATYTNKADSPSGLIDRALSKIERKVKEEKTDHLKKALSEIERKVERDKTKQSEKTMDKPEGDSRALFRVGKGGGLSGLSRLSGMSSGIGKGIQLYQMEIEGAIKDNWSYPVALLDSRGENIPEAVIIVTVRSDGKILRIRFKRKSQNALFDESVLKAIEKSDPLPKFPPGYRKSHDEVEINFSLKDLVQY